MMIATILSKLFSMVMLFVFALSVLMLILTYRKPKKLSLRSIGITLAMSLLSIILFSSIIGSQVTGGVWLIMALIGGAIGWFWARTTQVYLENNEVMSCNSTWYLAVWGGIFALNQLITIATSRPPNIAMPMLILSTFIIWGTNSNIIKRYFDLRPNLAVPPARVAAFNIGVAVGPLNQNYGNYTPQPQIPAAGAPVIPAARRATPTTPPPPAPKPASPFEEAAARYAALKTEIESGAISRAAFLQQVNELRFQDAAGIWLQLAEDGQGWLRWDGSRWVAGTRC